MKREPIATLAADPANPRRIKPDALEGLGVSLREFGDLSGLVWNKRDGRLVAGHQRLASLTAAGATEWIRTAEGGFVEHPQTHERFPVRVVDWNAQMARAANLAANNPHIQGDFTEDALAQLAELAESLPSFEDLRLDDMMAGLAALPGVPSSAADDDPLRGEDESGRLKDGFAIIVTCRSETEQRDLLARFMADGLQCRALI